MKRKILLLLLLVLYFSSIQSGPLDAISIYKSSRYSWEEKNVNDFEVTRDLQYYVSDKLIDIKTREFNDGNGKSHIVDYKNFYKYYINDLAYNGKIYVASANNADEHSNYYGALYISYDGANWENLNLATGTTKLNKTNKVIHHLNSVNAVVWGKDKFVAVGRANIMTSLDGINWTVKIWNNPYDINDIIWDGKKYIAVGGEILSHIFDTKAVILESEDGIEWTSTDIKELGWQCLTKIKYNNGLYVATNSETIMISEDGKKWTKVPGPLDNVEYKPRITDVHWTGSKLYTTFNTYAYFSADFNTWKKYTMSTNNTDILVYGFHDVQLNGKKLIATGAGGTTDESRGIFESFDGIKWTPLYLPTEHFARLAVINDKIFAFGYEGNILVGNPIPAQKKK